MENFNQAEFDDLIKMAEYASEQAQRAGIDVTVEALHNSHEYVVRTINPWSASDMRYEVFDNAYRACINMAYAWHLVALCKE